MAPSAAPQPVAKADIDYVDRLLNGSRRDFFGQAVAGIMAGKAAAALIPVLTGGALSDAALIKLAERYRYLYDKQHAAREVRAELDFDAALIDEACRPGFTYATLKDRVASFWPGHLAKLEKRQTEIRRVERLLVTNKGRVQDLRQCGRIDFPDKHLGDHPYNPLEQLLSRSTPETLAAAEQKAAQVYSERCAGVHDRCRGDVLRKYEFIFDMAPPIPPSQEPDPEEPASREPHRPAHNPEPSNTKARSWSGGSAIKPYDPIAPIPTWAEDELRRISDQNVDPKYKNSGK